MRAWHSTDLAVSTIIVPCLLHLRTCNLALVLGFVLAFYPFSFPAKRKRCHLFGQSCILHCQSPPSPDMYTANRFGTLRVWDAKPPTKHEVLLQYT